MHIRRENIGTFQRQIQQNTVEFPELRAMVANEKPLLLLCAINSLLTSPFSQGAFSKGRGRLIVYCRAESTLGRVLPRSILANFIYVLIVMVIVKLNNDD